LTDASTIRFATIGVNLFDALRIGQVDAAMVQEPALSLIVAAGGRELVNFMDIDQSRTHLGGAYEFMGIPCAPRSAISACLRCAGWPGLSSVPAPSRVGRVVVQLFAGGQIWPHLQATLVAAFGGLAAGLVLGVGLKTSVPPPSVRIRSTRGTSRLP
jgi:hypothetical protein